MTEEKSQNNSDKEAADQQDSLPLLFAEEATTKGTSAAPENNGDAAVKTEKSAVGKTELKQDQSDPVPDKEKTDKSPKKASAVTLKLVDSSVATTAKKANAIPLTPKKAESTPKSSSTANEAPKAPIKLEAEVADKTESKPAPVKLEAKVADKTESKPAPVKQVKTTSSTSVKKPENGKQANSKEASAQDKPVKQTGKPANPAKNTDKTDAEKELPAKAPLQKKPVHIVGNISSDKVTIGQILQESRVSYDLSLNQVEQITKIKKSFVESLERDDLTNLPPLVYVSAYVKTLCDLYEIDQEETAEILKRVKEKNNTSPVSEEIISHLEEEKQINHDEEIKIKRIFIIAVAAIILMVIAGSIIFSVYFSPDKKGKGKTISENGKTIANTVTAKPLTESQIKKLLPHQITTMTELDIPK